MAYPHKWSPISYKSSAGQRKHIGQRPMLYRWTTPPEYPGKEAIKWLYVCLWVVSCIRCISGYVILQNLLWLPCVADADIIFCPVVSFYLLSSFFYSSPYLSCHRLDVYHTSTHGVALVQI